MQFAASNLFEQINLMRTDIDPCSYFQFEEIWAERECQNFLGVSLDPFEWNEALSRAARHVINEMGACGTIGDANADFIPEVLKKYYAYDFEGLSFIKVTSPELMNLDDWGLTGYYALQYILAQESIDNSIFYNFDPLKMGIGCGCD